uniref:ACT domain-containing protein n=1 Tax=Steinernema glaseri TaxID=37863 RepID=A0A1I7YSV0_9BILA
MASGQRIIKVLIEDENNALHLIIISRIGLGSKANSTTDQRHRKEVYYKRSTTSYAIISEVKRKVLKVHSTFG